MASSLTAVRARLYGYTRPAFACLGVSAAVAADTLALPQPTREREEREEPPPSSSRLAALPLLAIGTAGVVAVARRHARLSWLAHGYESWAWGVAYGGLSAAAVAALLPGIPHGEDASLLAPSAGAALAATAGERLGSAVGRAAFPALVGVGVLSAGAALRGDAFGERAARALQMSALVLLPALQLACPPVYTLSLQGTLACAWIGMGAGATALESTPALFPSPEAARHVLVAVGAASLLRTLATRAPLCQF